MRVFVTGATGSVSSGPAMPVIKPVLHHVTFKTTRLDEMMAWYATVLG
jgi:hypothetical protein